MKTSSICNESFPTRSHSRAACWKVATAVEKQQHLNNSKINQIVHAAVTTLSLGQLSQFTAATAGASVQSTLVLVNFHRKLNWLTTSIHFTAIYLVQSVSAPHACHAHTNNNVRDTAARRRCVLHPRRPLAFHMSSIFLHPGQSRHATCETLISPSIQCVRV